jgi:probable phosphoglycerate mutase
MSHLVIFARHGRTAWNRDGRYQGRSDPPLASDGEIDAHDLARTLGAEPISRIICSPLLRASRTAAIVADRLGDAPISHDARLVEIAYGDWEGLTQAEIKARWPEDMRLWKRSPSTMRFPGGESLAQARARLVSFLSDDALWATSGDGAPSMPSTLVVAHSGLIRIAILEANKGSYRDFRKIPVGPGSIHRFVLNRVAGAAAVLTT